MNLRLIWPFWDEISFIGSAPEIKVRKEEIDEFMSRFDWKRAKEKERYNHMQFLRNGEQWNEGTEYTFLDQNLNWKLTSIGIESYLKRTEFSVEF